MNAVCLVIKNSVGAGVAPVADFGIDNQSPVVGDTLQLTDLSTGNPSTWAWYVNEVLFSTDQNPTYYCGDTGYLRFVLTVTNPYGTSTSSEQAVYVASGGGGGGIQP